MAYRVTINEKSGQAIIGVRATSAGRKAAHKTLGFALPALGNVSAQKTRSCIAISPDEWLVLVPDAEEQAQFDALDAAIAGIGGAVVVVTDAYTCLHLGGVDAIDVMAQTIPLDLNTDAGATDWAWRTTFGRASALVHRYGKPAEFNIYVDSTQARYAWRLLQACSGE